ncbi:MAG: 1-acyl-sn-glycerol-3-phosphate acyltransferase [Gammaproteobacteria bacterium]|nr:1-acyl-sn-glycerol-3-phosphate acyltransferase [Gammaproteobacteria bacterium]
MFWFNFFIFLLLVWLVLQFLRACENASRADWGGAAINRFAGFISLYCRYFHRFQFDPLPLPEQGGALVAANHMSGLDPFLLIAASPRPLRFLIAREEYERFGLNWLFRRGRCIPVDRDRRPERALREALMALERGDVVVLFPHGGIHLDSDPPRKLKGGVVRLAQKMGLPICPVRLDGVRGAGHTVPALVIPGRARLKVRALLDCEGLDHEHCLAQLAHRLEAGHV